MYTEEVLLLELPGCGGRPRVRLHPLQLKKAARRPCLPRELLPLAHPEEHQLPRAARQKL